MKTVDANRNMIEEGQTILLSWFTNKWCLAPDLFFPDFTALCGPLRAGIRPGSASSHCSASGWRRVKWSYDHTKQRTCFRKKRVSGAFCFEMCDIGCKRQKIWSAGDPRVVAKTEGHCGGSKALGLHGPGPLGLWWGQGESLKAETWLYPRMILRCALSIFIYWHVGKFHLLTCMTWEMRHPLRLGFHTNLDSKFSGCGHLTVLRLPQKLCMLIRSAMGRKYEMM